MNPHHSRRQFLRNMGLAAGASVAGTSWIMGESRRTRRSSLARRGLTRVIAFADSYGSQTSLCGIGGAIAATGSDHSSPVTVLVSVTDTEQLINTLQQEKGLPFNKVYAEGNTLAFKYSGRDYLIENLSPADYEDRIAQIHSQGVGSEEKNAPYAHDYLTYETKSRKLTDPYQAIKGNKITLKKVLQGDTPLDFDDVLHGLIESSTLKIEPSASVSNEWATILTNTSPDDPQAIVHTLLTRLRRMANTMKQDKVTELLSSPLVSSAIFTVLEVKSQTIIAEFHQLKSRARRSSKASHLWQAAFLASNSQGSSNRTLQDGFLNKAPLSGRHTAGARWKEACHLCP